ncbi:serine hydrolase domain-containing protein [Rhizobium etli]|uniref:serine hydrolase domain-containing protein n=1 Tax=Rhizobium etli TaxID=29449 RepID=UPI0003839B6F|nr:serine hydrolase domain-containing protein [Rhizobium etli]AGS24504.1 beta-lactamase/transpeptidase-like protein [Rhizobium etli bv. mimosae str. Mim1]
MTIDQEKMLVPTLNRLANAATLGSEICQIFRARVEEGRTPGACFVVFDETGSLLNGAAGKKNDDGVQPDLQTFFRIASCTKSFTAAMILILRDRGELDLDTPITHFVPELRPMLPPVTPVAPTIRMLLAMAGGLPTDNPWADRLEAISGRELRGILADGIRFQSAPGSSFEYSNLGYALLGQVIEEVTGLTFCDAVAEAILKPLGLHATRFDFTAVPTADLAIGYRRAAGEWVRLPFSGPGAFSCIGGLISTPLDLAAWVRWLISAFDADAEDGNVLSAASRREMQQIACPILPTNSAGSACSRGYGFGLHVDEDDRFGRIVYHSGGYPGFTSHMRWSVRERIGIVAFENATYCATREPAAEGLRKVLDSLPEVKRVPEVKSDISHLVERLKSLIGEWDDEIANEIFHSNVPLDCPYQERASEIMTLTGQNGRPDMSLAEIVVKDHTHFDLMVPCGSGVLRCSAQLGPTMPPRIQALTVSHTNQTA